MAHTGLLYLAAPIPMHPIEKTPYIQYKKIMNPVTYAIFAANTLPVLMPRNKHNENSNKNPDPVETRNLDAEIANEIEYEKHCQKMAKAMQE